MRWVTAFLVLCCAFPALVLGAAPKAPTVEDFVRKSSYDSVKIAPDGKHVATQFLRGDQHVLAVLDVKTLKFTGMLSFEPGQEVQDFWWVGPNRVIASIALAWGALDQMGSAGELYGMDADGSHKAYLLGFRGGSTISAAATMRQEHERATVLDNRILSPERMIIALEPMDLRDDRGHLRLRTMDVRSGATAPLPSIPYPSASVAFSAKGRPEFAIGYDNDHDGHLLRLPEDSDKWIPATEPQGTVESAYVLGARLDDPTQVAYVSNEGGDTRCLRNFDLAKGASTVLNCDGRVDVGAVDFSPVSRKPVAVTYEDGYPRTVVLEPDSAEGKVIRMLADSFPRQRVRITSSTWDGNLSVILVDSDRNPGDFYLLDRVKMKADYLLSRRDWIDPEQMRPMEAIRYKTRDGATIDGYLTRPAGDPKAKVPLILMPHGGPHGIRDDWSWDPWTQWLALNGFAVLQVNYRGSGGYGRAHQEAGYRHWGTLMMDDLTDAVHWAVDTGVTEPGRVCIYGASFGGYASMMSVVKEPDLYRCAAMYAGVYDLAAQGKKSDIGEHASGRAYLAEVVSDDSEEMAKNSPVTYVDRLKVPVLIAHGTEDERVPYNQAQLLKGALDKAHKPYEWHIYGGEMHGLYKDENHIDLLKSLVAFFSKNIGTASPGGGARGRAGGRCAAIAGAPGPGGIPMQTASTTVPAALALIAAAANAAAPPTPTIEDFVRKPKFESALIAPDGNHVALKIVARDKKSIGIIDLASRKTSATMGFPYEDEVYTYWWVGPTRLVVALASQEGVLDQPAPTGELMAIDADGGHRDYLFGYRGGMDTGPHRGGGQKAYASAYMIDTRLLAPRAALIGIDRWQGLDDRGSRELHRLDVKTGETKLIAYLPVQYPFSVAFGDKGQPLLAEGWDEHGHERLLRPAEGEVWRDALPEGAQPRTATVLWARLDDPNRVSYLSDEGSDVQCLREYDMKAGTSSLLACDPRVDVDDVRLASSNRAPVAAMFEDGLPRTVILDPEAPDAKTLQMLGRTFEHQRVRITSSSDDGSRMIVLVDSDRNPGDFYLFDRSTKNAEYLMSRREWIEPEQMRPMEPIRYKTRDGATIDGYLTRPAGDPKAKVPLILVPHGGPEARDIWAWDPWAQWFASRGYAVLQVNFRGSAGYGDAHRDAGRHHWGDRMQDDLTDAVKWAIETGMTDAQHVCIAGASYGGYAAVMSAVREPGLYRCGAAVSGIYDLPAHLKQTDAHDFRTGRQALELILGSDTAALTAQSPIHLVDRLQAPLFIAHGTEDQRVDFDQAKALRKALDKAGKPYEWHVYEGEEHGFHEEANEADLLRTMTAFFDRNIGPGAPAVSVPAPAAQNAP